MSDFDWDAFTKEAEKDTRVGKHTFVVDTVVHDTWGDGRPRHKFRGMLVTAGNAKTDMTLSAAPTADEAKEAMANGDAKRMRGIAYSKKNHDALGKYGKTCETLAEGDELRVETTKDKEGFVRVSRILSPETAVEVRGSGSGPGF